MWRVRGFNLGSPPEGDTSLTLSIHKSHTYVLMLLLLLLLLLLLMLLVLCTTSSHQTLMIPSHYSLGILCCLDWRVFGEGDQFCSLT